MAEPSGVRMENMDNVSSHHGSPQEKQMVGEDQLGFGRFLADLKISLTKDNIRMLTTALDFKPAERDKVETSEDPCHVFVHLLKEKGIISLTNISALTEELKICGLHGVADDVNKSFGRCHSETNPRPSKSQEYEEKKTKLVTELREKYKNLCGGIFPVPFLREKYDINELFVESGIKFLVEKERNNENEKWTVLKDYKAVFTDPRIKSKRRIIDGEPGYGKSTLSLQITHDWCHKKSPMHNFEILILLRLRQFKNVPTVYNAIKKFLLPRDSKLNEDDIKKILDNSQTLIILDGYDEYPDRGNKESDIEYIIRGDMFQQHDVVLMTRTSCLPLDPSRDTKRIRLTGFDDATRDMYIRNVVARGSSEDANKINLFLSKNRVLIDLCKIPLFFTMVSHMAHINERFHSITTVTEFFRHIIKCFHSHEQIRKAEGKQQKKEFVRDHSTLDKIAFEGLSRAFHQISWNAADLHRKVPDVYDEYIRIGILVEEEVYNCNAIDYETETRFYHKLFHEWYAAHHLAKEADQVEAEFEPWSKKVFHSLSYIQTQAENSSEHRAPTAGKTRLLKSVSPNGAHYMYRFACGLNPNAAVKIIEHLGKNDDFDQHTLLCMTEWGGSLEEIVSTVASLCSRRIDFNTRNSLLLQESTVELVKFASSNKIPVSEVYLCNCLDSGFLSTGNLCVKPSNLSLPVIASLKELVIYEIGVEIKEEEAEGIFQYSSKCPGLTHLTFNRCLIPRFIKATKSLSVLKSQNVAVWWNSGRGVCLLNHENGQWEKGSSRTLMTDEEYHHAMQGIREYAEYYSNSYNP